MVSLHLPSTISNFERSAAWRWLWLTLFAAAPAFAQSSSEHDRLEHITVTANRRVQNTQNIAASVSVVSGAQLAARNVHDVFGLQFLTPSLQVTPQFGSGQPAFTIRGVGFNDYASDNASTVSISIDEVAQPIPFATNGLIFDVSRVEVLRGPQGTLYGRNSTGGAINYVLNHPTEKREAKLSFQYGRFGSIVTDGVVSGHVLNHLNMRLSAQSQQGGAWQDGDGGARLGMTDRTAARWISDLTLDDSTTMTLDLHGSHDRSDAQGLHLFTPLTTLASASSGPVFPADSNRDATHWGTSTSFARLAGINPMQKPFHHIDSGGANLRLEKTLPFGSLTDLVSFDAANRREYDNFDGSSAAIADVAFNTRANSFANELRLKSHDDRPLTWIGGIYYAHQYLADQYLSGFAQSFGINRSVAYRQNVNTVSGFGQLRYQITHELALTGGFRIEHESRVLQDFAAYNYLPSGLITNPGNIVGRRSLNYTKPSGKFELDYHPVEHDMIYASVSRGIKSGGFTTYNTVAARASTDPFRPEELWAYELGNKAEFPSAHLRLNVSAFYYDYHNEQIQSAVVNPSTGLIGAIVNAPRSHVAGGEFEAQWSPLPHLILTQSGGWAVGQFDRFSSVFATQRVNGVYVPIVRNRRGDSLPAPKLTFNGSATYSWNIGHYILRSGINYSLRSTYHSLFGNLYDVAGYTLVGANASFGPRSGLWSIAAFGNNILNKRYDVERNFFVNGDNIALAGLPATWGARVSLSF
ncbi:TonB-dependent receptor [Kozakia baliensis]|uniref:TonB-dependent receptor n=1 Tax=Kozakia baliensis TaxID=153496 RepID=UPI00345C4E6B